MEILTNCYNHKTGLKKIFLMFGQTVLMHSFYWRKDFLLLFLLLFLIIRHFLSLLVVMF